MEAQEFAAYTLSYLYHHLIRHRLEFWTHVSQKRPLTYRSLPIELWNAPNLCFEGQNIFRPYIPLPTEKMFMRNLQNQVSMMLGTQFFQIIPVNILLMTDELYHNMIKNESALVSELVKMEFENQKIPFISNMNLSLLLAFLDPDKKLDMYNYDMRAALGERIGSIPHLTIGTEKTSGEMETWLWQGENGSRIPLGTSKWIGKSYNEKKARILAHRILDIIDYDVMSRDIPKDDRELMAETKRIVGSKFMDASLEWIFCLPEKINENIRLSFIFNTESLGKLPFLSHEQKQYAFIYDMVSRAMVFKNYNPEQMKIINPTIRSIFAQSENPAQLAAAILYAKDYFPFSLWLTPLAMSRIPDLDMAQSTFVISCLICPAKSKNKRKVFLGLQLIFPYYAQNSMSIPNVNAMFERFSPMKMQYMLQTDINKNRLLDEQIEKLAHSFLEQPSRILTF